jgi:cob(I)alamin adenosyltransferase
LLAKKSQKGLVQVFTGNGKGKTSAALGAILRALGHDLRVYIVFFMKGKYPYGEFSMLSRLPNVDAVSFGLRCFIDPEHIKPEEIEQAKLALSAAREAIFSGRYDLVVLDEVNIAVHYRLIELDEVVGLIETRPANVELILTGRYAKARLIELADLVTEMVKLKHPYDKGIRARKGIEY